MEYGQRLLEGILIQRNILVWILHQRESWQGRVKLALACINTQELGRSIFLVYFYQAHTHTQIIPLSHCTGFPGNWTSFLKLYAAQLIRTLILPWLWLWWCWWHRTRQDQEVWINVSELGRVSPVGCKLHSHQDHSSPSAQTCQRFHFTHLPADTFALSLGGDKALCFLVALEHLNTAHETANIRVCSKQKGLRRVSTSRNTDTKAWSFWVKYKNQKKSTGGRNAELVCLQGLLTLECLMSNPENYFLTANICNTCF